uniref:MAPK regulated corepressor interacting protein 2 n=1 Tax=Hucho hucho TaxID=62062 RepID=A0A4W5QZT5_9TELE
MYPGCVCVFLLQAGRKAACIQVVSVFLLQPGRKAACIQVVSVCSCCRLAGRLHVSRLCLCSCCSLAGRLHVSRLCLCVPVAAWQEVVQQAGEGGASDVIGSASAQGPVQYSETKPSPNSAMKNFVPIDLDEWWAQRFLANIDNLS